MLEKLCWIVLDKFTIQSLPQEPYSYQVCNSMYECDFSVVKLHDSDFWALSQKFWKATMNIVISACMCVRMEQHSFHGTDFHEVW